MLKVLVSSIDSLCLKRANGDTQSAKELIKKRQELSEMVLQQGIVETLSWL